MFFMVGSSSVLHTIGIGDKDPWYTSTMDLVERDGSGENVDPVAFMAFSRVKAGAQVVVSTPRHQPVSAPLSAVGEITCSVVCRPIKRGGTRSWR